MTLDELTLWNIREAGRHAFVTGMPPAHNPYYPQTDGSKAWFEGYEKARGPLPKLGPLEYPALSYDSTPRVVTKTHKLAANRFAAVGAIYFKGYRGMYLCAVGETRRAAEKAVMSILDPDPNAAYRSEARLRAMGG
jgi:hypothetical protein